MIAILLAAQTPVTMPTTARGIPVPRTLGSETLPTYRFACSVQDVARRSYRIVLTQKGGRAYNDPESSYIQQTDLETLVELDEASAITGYRSNMPLVRPGYEASFVNLSDGRIPSQNAAVRIEEGRQRQYVIMVSRTWPVVLVDYIGFCTVVKQAQLPLSIAETKKYLAR